MVKDQTCVVGRLGLQIHQPLFDAHFGYSFAYNYVLGYGIEATPCEQDCYYKLSYHWARFRLLGAKLATFEQRNKGLLKTICSIAKNSFVWSE